MYFRAEQLTCVKGKRRLFKNLSFSLSGGQLLLVQGQNGSGKSSLLKMLAGLSSCESGSIKTDSELAYVGHKEGIKRGLTVFENIALQLALAKRASNITKLDEVLTSFRMAPLKEMLCSALSMGQRRKVALATLILKQKPIWILDEPFTGLDKESVNELCERFSAHTSINGIVIVASHAVEALKAHQTIELTPC